MERGLVMPLLNITGGASRMVGRAKRGEPQSAGALLFASDWSTATGTTDAARRDTDQTIPWTSLDTPGSPSDFEVVAASGVTLFNGGGSLAAAGWPTTNALRSIIHAGSATVTVNDQWAHPGVGDTLYMRCYMCHDGDDALGGTENDNSFHSPQCGPAGNAPFIWAWSFNNRGAGGAADGTFRPTFRNNAGVPSYRFRGPVLNKGTVYRWEWRITRTATDTLSFDVRVYDADGVLLHDGSDYLWSQDNTTPMTDISTIPYPETQQTEESLRGAMSGANQGGMPLGVELYWGAFAVSSTGWCGPYVNGEGP